MGEILRSTWESRTLENGMRGSPHSTLWLTYTCSTVAFSDTWANGPGKWPALSRACSRPGWTIWKWAVVFVVTTKQWFFSISLCYHRRAWRSSAHMPHNVTTVGSKEAWQLERLCHHYHCTVPLYAQKNNIAGTPHDLKSMHSCSSLISNHLFHVQINLFDRM
jgi:hypothetical protein